MQEENSIVIKYNTPIEVSKEQYKFLMNEYSGIVAGRVSEDGKFYIRVWVMKFANDIAKILKPKPSVADIDLIEKGKSVTSLSGKT